MKKIKDLINAFTSKLYWNLEVPVGVHENVFGITKNVGRLHDIYLEHYDWCLTDDISFVGRWPPVYPLESRMYINEPLGRTEVLCQHSLELWNKKRDLNKNGCCIKTLRGRKIKSSITESISDQLNVSSELVLRTKRTCIVVAPCFVEFFAVKCRSEVGFIL